MMERIDLHWIVTCDDCDETLDTETSDEREAVQVAMNNGWTMQGNYMYCEQCTEDHRDDEA